MFFKKIKKDLETVNTVSEFARPIDWTPKWSIGAPMPQVFSNGRKVYLIYYIDKPDPELDGTNVTVISDKSDEIYPLALVEFSGHTFRFGIANEEVFSGLPLWGRGLVNYEAHIIENSSWITEIKKINKVHPYFNEKQWNDWKHYMLLFHDEILEVIAKDFKVETFNMSFEDLASIVIKRMYE